MPKVSKDSAKHDDYGPVESWHEEVDGYAIEFVQFKQDIDSTPLLKGLPNDQCHCPHWGYVLKGRLRISYSDRDEVLQAGDYYYMPAGHTGVAEEDTEFLEVAPLEEHQRFIENAQRILTGA